MSQYSEMMGSFIRTGNFPMEANYIFSTEAALKEFYNDPINATTIHKGLLRIVENGGDGKLALYWVVLNLTSNELEFVKLIEDIDIDNINEKLEELQTKLDEEINNRKLSENAIWGTTDPTNIPEDLNSILDLATELDSLRLTVTTIYSGLKATVGTQKGDIVGYLLLLPYKSLTETVNALNKFLNTVDETTSLIDTLPELQSFLEGYTDTDKLSQVLTNLLTDIMGTPVPSENFRTLRAIEDFVRILQASSENRDNNILNELDNTQVGIGLSGDGSYNSDAETHYLKDATSVMNALKVLDSLMYEALSNMSIQASNTDVVDLTVRKEAEGYVIGAELNLSNIVGNDLLKKDDGLYLNINSTYNNGILSLYINDELAALHILGFSSIVESALYDPSQEAIIIVFKLLSGESQTITVPVGALIRELVVDNDQPSKVVELTRETVIDGPDKLSADVRLYNDKHNILLKVGNTLTVEGTTSNLTHRDLNLEDLITNLLSRVTYLETGSTLSFYTKNEIDNLLANKADLVDGKLREDLIPDLSTYWDVNK